MEKQNLDILPGGILPVIHCSQGDIGRQFQINLYSDNAPYVLDGTEELTLDGHKEDGNIFTYSLDPVTGSTITISTEEQMTACAGNTICEIRIFKGTTRLGTCNFILQVEEGPSNGTLSESALQALDEIRAEVQAAVEDAEDASEAASDYANTSKNWAVGPNGSGSGTDTNNSKYYSQQSANSATAASNSASAAHTSELNAAASESNAATSESNASISETNASNSATAASNSASAANTSANNASTSATAANNAKNDAVSAKNDAVTAKNAAEAAQQKIENMTASASQLPEGSTPTVTKSEVGGVVNLAFGIPKGDTGDTGPRGADGLGVPAGGTTGQILAKASNADNDTEWIDAPSGGGVQYPIINSEALAMLYPIAIIDNPINYNPNVVLDLRNYTFGTDITLPRSGDYFIAFGQADFSGWPINITDIHPFELSPVRFIETYNADTTWYDFLLTTLPMTSRTYPELGDDVGISSNRLLPDLWSGVANPVNTPFSILKNGTPIDPSTLTCTVNYYYNNYTEGTLVNDHIGAIVTLQINCASTDILKIDNFFSSAITISSDSDTPVLQTSGSESYIHTWNYFN